MPTCKRGSPEDHVRDRRDLRALDLLDQGLSTTKVAKIVGLSQAAVWALKKERADS